MKKRTYFMFILAVIGLLLIGCGNAKPDFKDMDINGGVVIPIKESYSSWDELRSDLFDMLCLYETKDNKRVYSMGTMHSIYGSIELGYSFADLIDTIDMIQPDMILLETHDDSFQKYGAIDGPAEMLFTCGYAQTKGIPVYGIDYWELDNDILNNINTTNNNRDNQMFYNIYDKVVEAKENSTIFVIFGGEHFYNAIPRMELVGWERKELDTSEYYKHIERESYQYPEKIQSVVQNTINYYETEYVEKIKASITEEAVCEQMMQKNAATVENLRRVLEWLGYNAVY